MTVRRRVLDAWLQDLRVGWGERAVRSATAITPVIALGDAGDLHAIGHHFAVEGHSLEVVVDWFRLLASKSWAFRQVLAGGGIIHLAGGWADGLLHDDTAQAVTSFEILRLRIRQQVQRGHVGDERPGAHLALVIIESNGSAASVERITQHARAAFHTGETMAATPSGKLMILADRDQYVRERTLQVTDAIRADNELVDTAVRVWIEPLAMSADHVDSHLLGLAS